jgi:NitT/TauT family transport system substrate-binding protein
MSKTKKLCALGLILVGILGVAVVWPYLAEQTGEGIVIRYGISPFQDTAMPKVSEGIGLFEKHGLAVELISVGWEDIVPSLASGGRTIDVAIGSINTFLPRAENINKVGGGDVRFFFPLYVFKGATLLMQKDSEMTSLTHFNAHYPKDRNLAIKEAMLQLKGKTIAVPKGTPYEQMLYAGLEIAGMDPERDVDIRNVKLADALLAFRNGDVDVIGAGVTQRTEATRDGAQVFLDMDSFGFAEIVGLMTTQKFADEHPEVLEKIIVVWFESVRYLFEDVEKNSRHVLDYLDATSSTKYSLEEYKKALSFQEFPRSIDEADKLLMAKDSKFFWRRTWDIVNDYLIKQGDIKEKISTDYTLMDRMKIER